MNALKLIVIVILIITLYTFTRAGKINSDMVQYNGDAYSKEKALKLVDKVLKEQGNFGVYGDLSSGINAVSVYMNIRIVEKPNSFDIEIYPKSGSGHDFSFMIDKKDLKISGLAVGEIVQPPEN